MVKISVGLDIGTNTIQINSVVKEDVGNILSEYQKVNIEIGTYFILNKKDEKKIMDIIYRVYEMYDIKAKNILDIRIKKKLSNDDEIPYIIISIEDCK